MVRTCILALAVLIMGGCISEDPMPPDMIETPEQQYRWKGAGGGFRDWRSGGDYLYGVSVASLVDVWAWSEDGSLQRLIEEQPVDKGALATEYVVWKGEIKRFNKVDEMPALVVSSLDGKQKTEVEIGKFWWLREGVLSSNGRYVGLVFGVETNDNPNWERDQDKVLVAVYDLQEEAFKGVVLQGDGVEKTDTSIYGIRPSDCGKYLAIGGWGGGVSIVEMATEKVLWESAYIGAEKVFWSADSKTVYSVGYVGHMHRFDALTGKVLDQWNTTASGESGGYIWRMSTVAVSRNGRYVAAGSGPMGLVFLWDSVTGRRLGVFNHGPSTILLLSFSPDSKRLASYEGGTIKVWTLP